MHPDTSRPSPIRLLEFGSARRQHEDQLIEERLIRRALTNPHCPWKISPANCGVRGQWTELKAFSGLLKTSLVPLLVEPACTACVPGNCTGVFVFANVAAARKPPLRRGQISKSFRNRNYPSNSILLYP